MCTNSPTEAGEFIRSDTGDFEATVRWYNGSGWWILCLLAHHAGRGQGQLPARGAWSGERTAIWAGLGSRLTEPRQARRGATCAKRRTLK